MKAAPNNVIIYTVAFLHGGADPQAQAILANCATDAKHAYVPTDGTSLTVGLPVDRGGPQQAADLPLARQKLPCLTRRRGA